MNEVDYYESFSKKFKNYLQEFLGKDFRIYYSNNKSLDTVIKELQNLSGEKLIEDDVFVTNLKVDIVFAIFPPEGKCHLILIEAKVTQLILKDYSQLVGYLQVAKFISLGLLLQIQKGRQNNRLSNDFQDIVQMKKLPMEWTIHIHNSKEEYGFHTGIITYLPGNGIDWVDTKDINGISSFDDLCAKIKE